MKHFRPVLTAFFVIIALTSCGRNTNPVDEPGGGDGISGRVTAPRGVAVAGTLVIACPASNRGIDCGAAEAGGEAGRNGSYTIDVQTGNYGILAWKDENGDEELNVGDYLGIYSEDGQNPEIVRPPADGIDVEIQEAQAAMRHLELKLNAPKTKN